MTEDAVQRTRSLEVPVESIHSDNMEKIRDANQQNPGACGTITKDGAISLSSPKKKKKLIFLPSDRISIIPDWL